MEDEGETSGRRRRASGARAQSNVIGIALVLGLALTSALLIAGISTVTLEEGRQVGETEHAVQSMTELDSKTSLVALEGGEAETVDLEMGDARGQVEVRDDGNLRMVLTNTSAGVSCELLDRSLGAAVYRNGDQRVTYQGGGVWRRNVEQNGSAMVSPPEVHYRGETLTLPLVRVSGSEASASDVRIRRTGTEEVFPDGGAGCPAEVDETNPVPESRELTLFVTSEYYQGWADYFERRVAAGAVTVHHNNETAEVDLVSLGPQFTLADGLVSVGQSGTILLSGAGPGPPNFVDSYNSTVGRYGVSKSGNGTVQTLDGMDLNGGGSFINGSVDSGGPVTLSGNSSVLGNVAHQGFTQGGHPDSEVTGWTNNNGTGVDVPPVDNLVQDQVDDTCTPANTTTVSGGTVLDVPSGDDEEFYCVDGDLDLSSETVEIDLSNGNVSLAVDGNIELNDARIEVTNSVGNDHKAKIWMAGNRMDMQSQSNVTVIDGSGDATHDSTAMQLYGPSDTTVSMQSQSSFTGLVFAPAEAGSGGELNMQSESVVFGAAVVGHVDMQGGSVVHYDEALGGFTVDRRGVRSASELSYLHVTLNEVSIEG